MKIFKGMIRCEIPLNLIKKFVVLNKTYKEKNLISVLRSSTKKNKTKQNKKQTNKQKQN